MEAVKLFLNKLDKLFRYFLPGFVILGAAYCAYPSWFGGVKLTEASHLTILFAVAIVVGNVAYAVHRFSVHQLLDVGCWLWDKLRANVVGPFITWLLGRVRITLADDYRSFLKNALVKGLP